MTKEELKLIESLLINFLGYEVTAELMLADEITSALESVQRELKEKESEE